ncbi:MAG: Hsp20/alpha crystallin family protein [Gemmatimonadaceae bacterium]
MKERGWSTISWSNYGPFMRRFQLPPGVDNEMITAEFEQGVLAVSIPKTALPKPTEVQITTGAADKLPQRG